MMAGRFEFGNDRRALIRRLLVANDTDTRRRR